MYTTNGAYYSFLDDWLLCLLMMGLEICPKHVEVDKIN